MYIVDKLLCTRFTRSLLLVHVAVAGIMIAGDVEKKLLSLQEEVEFMHVVAAGDEFRSSSSSSSSCCRCSSKSLKIFTRLQEQEEAEEDLQPVLLIFSH